MVLNMDASRRKFIRQAGSFVVGTGVAGAFNHLVVDDYLKEPRCNNGVKLLREKPEYDHVPDDDLIAMVTNDYDSSVLSRDLMFGCAGGATFTALGGVPEFGDEKPHSDPSAGTNLEA